MKKLITPNLIKFAIATSVLTIVFRFALSHFLENGQNSWVIVSAISFGLAMFFSGFTFGKNEYKYLPIFDIGFRFHLVTYVFNMLFSELFFLLGFHSSIENISSVHSIGLIWGVFVIIHFLFYLKIKKNSINNLDKDNLFE